MNLILNFSGAPYAVPNGGAIGLDLATGGVVGPPPPPSKPDLVVTMIRPWGGTRLRVKSGTPAYAGGKRTQRAAVQALAHGEGQVKVSASAFATQALYARANASASTWGGWVERCSAYVQGWRVPEYRVHGYESAWGRGALAVSASTTGWHAPHLHVQTQEIDWAGNALVVDQWLLAWPVPVTLRYDDQALRWGRRWVPPYCEHSYEPPLDAPGGALQLRLKTPSYVPPAGGSVSLVFRLTDQPVHCYDGYQSGPKQGQPPPPTVHVVRRPYELEVYFMPATISAKRLSDNAPILLRNASVELNVDSWCWQLRADLASRADFDLVEPTGNVQHEIEVTINGHAWTFLVESASRGKRFGERVYPMSGRSRSAKLTSPYTVAGTHTESSAATAQQLATAALEFTGWALDWQVVDWLLPANTLSYSDKTPLDVVAMIAASVGAIVQTDMHSKTLHVISRYPVNAWALPTTPPAIALPENVVKTHHHDWRPGEPYNRVDVSGESTGVLLQLTREGTAGDKVAPMIVDRLLTDVVANRERGRVELCKAGKRSHESIDLPLATPPEEPALILPGTVVEVAEDGTTWRALCLSVAVQATADAVTTVNQRITLERWWP